MQENKFPTTAPVAMVYLVFITDDPTHQIEAYSTKEHAERARAHYHRRGFAAARVDARAIRSAHYLELIGA